VTGVQTCALPILTLMLSFFVSKLRKVMVMKKVLAIVGPRAIGKTNLAIDLAKRLNGEIISGDSMQVYQEVAVGTAKATAEEQAQVKHYLVDTQSVFDEYSVKDCVDQATKRLKRLAKKVSYRLLQAGQVFMLMLY